MCIRDRVITEHYSAEFWQEEQGLQNLLSALTAEGVTWSQRREHVYSDDELMMAPLLAMSVTTAPRGYGGPSYGTEYDLSQACARCGSGAVQVSPLVLRSSQIPKTGSLFLTLDFDFLFGQRLKELLAAEDFRGLELRQARAAKSQNALPWFQLLPRATLPPMAAETKGIVRENPCPQCGRDGYFNDSEAPLEIVYRAEQIESDGLPDIVATYELFGYSALREVFTDSHFARPLVLIKPRVWAVLPRDAKKRLRFEPVTAKPA